MTTMESKGIRAPTKKQKQRKSRNGSAPPRLRQPKRRPSQGGMSELPLVSARKSAVRAPKNVLAGAPAAHLGPALPATNPRELSLQAAMLNQDAASLLVGHSHQVSIVESLLDITESWSCGVSSRACADSQGKVLLVNLSGSPQVIFQLVVFARLPSLEFSGTQFGFDHGV